MAISSIPGVFGRSMFNSSIPQTKQKVAAAGFSQIFTTMLAKQMRQSMVGEDNGPMGISGGATGDIYGAFLDQAMGKALANSKSMSRFNRTIERELSGPRGSKAGALQLARSAQQQSGSLVSTLETKGAVSPIYTGVTMPADTQGPMLLPPSPSATAPLLLTPPSEG
jgi:hypothetical protein